jgi:structural maintenance of chromosome 3 (chondroitin sulfate proteoglycan 6)
MFIKRVKIEGFTSYEELKMEQDLSPGCNLVLGNNGCGKSNFLQAIIFALGESDEFKQKSRQDKRKYLHEGISGRS